MSSPSDQSTTSFSGTPKVAIVGRPNVGKSTLFNRLTRTRKALVKNEPGVTRDIIVEPAEWWGTQFDVVDTGGITEAVDPFSPMIRKQVLSMVSTFDLLVVVMDGRAGLVPEDRDVVRLAVESGKPFVIVVNKVDRPQESEMIASEFYEFGHEILTASFEHEDGLDVVVEWIREHLPESDSTQRHGRRIAVIGKPNVGKSSLCNFLLGHERMLVSDVAGTTVDAVEHQFSWEGEDYILVDTAGLRRPSKRKEGVEILSAFKSERAVAKADVVLLMVDIFTGPTDQDARMVEHILENHKAVLLVANKMDAAQGNLAEPRKTFRAQVEKVFHFFPNIPVVFVSAKTGSGMKNLFEKVEDIWQQLHFRISTSQLNKFFYEVIRQAPAPVWGTQNVRFYYLTQTQQVPPSFIAFANHPQGVTPAYRRFLTKRIQKNWDIQDVPIRLFVMRSGG